MKSIKLFCLIGSLFFGSIANAATNNSNSKIHRYELKNGLVLLVKEDHHSPAVVNMVWYRVGSAYEPSGITGISHALEHMMFQGTPLYPKGQFSKIVAENGGEENAFTAQDYTAYFEKLDNTLLPLAFKLESDRMHNLSLKAKDFSNEIQVVREERRMRTDDNPEALTYERFMAATYLSSPYHNPTIGWPDDLKNLNIEDLRHWYQTWYSPNNATIVVVGDVKAEDVFQQVKKSFGDISSKIIPPFKTHDEPKDLGPKDIIVKKSAKLPLIMMGYVTPSRVTVKKAESWQPYALTLLSGILDQGDSSRLATHLVRDSQIASEADAAYDMYTLYQTTFLLYGVPTKDHTAKEVKAALLKEIQALKDKPVSETELQRVKNQLIAKEIYSHDSLFQQASDIGMLVSIGLPPDAMDKDIEHLKAVTPEQIQQVAKEYLTPDRLTTAELVPQAFDPRSAPLQNPNLTNAIR